MKPIHTHEYTRMRERLKEARKAAGMHRSTSPRNSTGRSPSSPRWRPGSGGSIRPSLRSSPDYTASPSRFSWAA